MDGILVINKTKGCTSHDIVYKVKKQLNEKVGHTGTLDPNATGVLPLLIGKGTLCSKYLMEHDKIYEATLKLGIKTDTADGEGKIIEKKEVLDTSLLEQNINKILSTFIGKQKQLPPMYSAIKVNGKKLYEYARSGKNVKIEPRTIEIYSCNLIYVNKKEKEIKFKVHCSKGTYIRSLCEDIATKLNTVGYMKELNRIKVGKFKLEDSITIEELQNGINNELINSKIISIEKIFEEKESIVIQSFKLKHLLNGVKLTYKYPNGVYKIYNEENKFIGIGSIENELLKREIIL